MLNIKVTKSTHEVIIRGIEIPSLALIGSTLNIEGEVVNIGENEEDKIKVVYADDFGNLLTEERSGFDAGDSTNFTFSIKIPGNATIGAHSATLKVYYEYDEDDKSYDESSDGESITINVVQKTAKEPVAFTVEQASTTQDEASPFGEWISDNWGGALIFAVEAVAVAIVLSMLFKPKTF